ncbi:MAG: hypothetical protein C1O27_002076 [Chloroflexi bacterium]|nr:MAG: hypothetical protein C1O27_002076 [Chloroflexota bacterium]
MVSAAMVAYFTLAVFAFARSVAHCRGPATCSNANGLLGPLGRAAPSNG